MLNNKEIKEFLSLIGKCKVNITDTIEIESEKAKLVLFDYSGECDGESAAVVYDGGELFYLNDWQGGRPESFEEIEDYEWKNDGRTAFILNGMPRMLL